VLSDGVLISVSTKCCEWVVYAEGVTWLCYLAVWAVDNQIIYSYLSINIHSHCTAQWVGRYNVSNESEYVSSTHSPVQLHSNVTKPWALDTYSVVLLQLYAVVSIEHVRKLIAHLCKVFCEEMLRNESTLELILYINWLFW